MQPLSSIAGKGDEASAEYIAKRKVIEARHGDDDQTQQHWRRQHGASCDYNAPITELSDKDPVAILLAFGLTQRCVNLLEENGCEEIADVRSALQCCEIPTWFSCSDGIERLVKEAVERMDKR